MSRRWLVSYEILVGPIEAEDKVDAANRSREVLKHEHEMVFVDESFSAPLKVVEVDENGNAV